MFGIKTVSRMRTEYQPHEDYGFFGPESVTWKVWSYPTSYVLGFVRAVTIEHLDPNLAAAVVQSGGVKYRPHTRYGRTIRYFSMVAFGGTEAAARAADVLVKVHSKAIGNDPVTGGEYDANKGSSQLWIHMTAWHSILKCYEQFGPGRLSEKEENEYWEQCAIAAELTTADPAEVPRSREAVHKYFEEWRPHLAGSEAAQDMAKFILTIDVAVPPDTSTLMRLLIKPFVFVGRRAVIATFPRYMRKLFGINQGPLTDLLVGPPTKAYFALMHRSTQFYMWYLEFMAPQGAAAIAPVKLGIPPVSTATSTPRETQARLGLSIPSEAHLEMRAKQHERVFVQHVAPSDEGLEESQKYIGAMDPREAARVG